MRPASSRFINPTGLEDKRLAQGAEAIEYVRQHLDKIAHLSYYLESLFNLDRNLTLLNDENVDHHILKDITIFQGASAYELALVNGFQGSLAQWLESLKGEPGAPGEDGEDGDGYDGSATQTAMEAELNNLSSLLTALQAEQSTISDNLADYLLEADFLSQYSDLFEPLFDTAFEAAAQTIVDAQALLDAAVASLPTNADVLSTVNTEVNAARTQVEASIATSDASIADAHAQLVELAGDIAINSSRYVNLQSITDQSVIDISALQVSSGEQLNSILEIQTVNTDLVQTQQVLESVSDSHTASINNLNTVTGDTATQLNVLQVANNNQNASIVSLQEVTSDTATDLTALTVRTDDVEAFSVVTRSLTSDNATALSALTVRTDDAESSITSLETVTADHASRLTTVETNVGDNSASIATNAQTGADNASLYQGLEVRVSDAESDVVGLGSSITTLETVKADAAALTTQTERIDNLSSRTVQLVPPGIQVGASGTVTFTKNQSTVEVNNGEILVSAGYLEHSDLTEPFDFPEFTLPTGFEASQNTPDGSAFYLLWTQESTGSRFVNAGSYFIAPVWYEVANDQWYYFENNQTQSYTAFNPLDSDRIVAVGYKGASDNKISGLHSFVNHSSAQASISTLETTKADASDLSAASDRISSLEATVDTPTTGLSARVTSVESTKADQSDLTALATRADDIEAAYQSEDTAINSRITTVENTKADGSDLVAVADRTTVVEASISDLEDEDVALGSRISTVEVSKADASDLTTQAQRIDTIESEIDDPNTGINARISTVESTKADASDVTAQAGRLDTIESQIDTPNTGILARIQDVEVTKADQSDLTVEAARVDTLETRTDNTESSITTLEASKADQSNLTAEAARITAVESRTNTTEADISTLQSTKADQTSLDAEALRIDTMQAYVSLAVPPGIDVGLIGELEFTPNMTGSGANNGEILVSNGYVIHPTSGKVAITTHSIFTGLEGTYIVPNDVPAYLLYVDADKTIRFSEAQSTGPFVLVYFDFESEEWKYFKDNSSTTYSFTPNEDDRIVAAIRKEASSGGITNLRSLINYSDAQSQIETLSQTTANLTGANASRLDTVEASIGTNEGDISSLDARIVTAESAIVDLDNNKAESSVVTTLSADYEDLRTEFKSSDFDPNFTRELDGWTVVYNSSGTANKPTDYIDNSPHSNAAFYHGAWGRGSRNTGYAYMVSKPWFLYREDRTYEVRIEVVTRNNRTAESPDNTIRLGWARYQKDGSYVGISLQHAGGTDQETSDGIQKYVRRFGAGTDEPAALYDGQYWRPMFSTGGTSGAQSDAENVVLLVDVADVTDAAANAASIETEQTVRASETLANASQISALQATIDTPGTGLSARMTTVESVKANQADLLVEASKINSLEVSRERNGTASAINYNADMMDGAVGWYYFKDQSGTYNLEHRDHSSITAAHEFAVHESSEGRGLRYDHAVEGAFDCWAYSERAYPIDVTRRYRLKARILVNDPGNQNPSFYIGLVTLDGNFDLITGGSGTHRYADIEVMGSRVAGDIIELEGIYEGVGDGATQFRAGTKYVRLNFLLNYNDKNSDTTILECGLYDIEEESALSDTLSAAITTESSARAAGDSAAANRLDVIEADINTPTTGINAKISTLETTTVDLQNNKAEASAVTQLQSTLESADSALDARLTSAESTIISNDQATAQSFTDLEASVIRAGHSDGNLLVNGSLAVWPDTSDYPAGWRKYVSGTPTRVVEADGSLVARFDTDDATRSGMDARSNSLGNNPPRIFGLQAVAKGEYNYVSIDFRLNSGSLSGAGILSNKRNDDNSSHDSEHISLDAEFSSGVDLGRWYRMTKVFKHGSGIKTEHIIYVMANYEPFDGFATKQIDFKNIVFREATDLEIAEYDFGTGGISAKVSSLETATADLENDKAEATALTALSSQVLTDRAELEGQINLVEADVTSLTATQATDDAARSAEITSLNSEFTTLSNIVTSGEVDPYLQHGTRFLSDNHTSDGPVSNVDATRRTSFIDVLQNGSPIGVQCTGYDFTKTVWMYRLVPGRKYKMVMMYEATVDSTNGNPMIARINAIGYREDWSSIIYAFTSTSYTYAVADGVQTVGIEFTADDVLSSQSDCVYFAPFALLGGTSGAQSDGTTRMYALYVEDVTEGSNAQATADTAVATIATETAARVSAVSELNSRFGSQKTTTFEDPENWSSGNIGAPTSLASASSTDFVDSSSNGKVWRRTSSATLYQKAVYPVTADTVLMATLVYAVDQLPSSGTIQCQIVGICLDGSYGYIPGRYFFGSDQDTTTGLKTETITIAGSSLISARTGTRFIRFGVELVRTDSGAQADAISLTVASGPTAAAIVENQEAIATETSARVSAINSLTATVSGNTSDIGGNSSDILTNAANIGINLSSINDNTTDISTNTGDISSNTANISTNATAIATNDGQIASLTTDLSTTNSNVSVNAAAVSSLEDYAAAGYQVSVGSNGEAAGFRIRSVTNGNVTTTDFKISTDSLIHEADGEVIWYADSAGLTMNKAIRFTGGGTTNNPDTMYVIGNGFGNNGDLMEWFGPYSAGIGATSKTNGVRAKTTDGKTYLNGVQEGLSPVTASDTQTGGSDAELTSIDANGNTAEVSMSYLRSGTKGYFSSTDPGNATYSQGSAVVKLYVKQDSGSYVLEHTANVTGTVVRTVGEYDYELQAYPVGETFTMSASHLHTFTTSAASSYGYKTDLVSESSLPANTNTAWNYGSHPTVSVSVFEPAS